MFTSGEKFGLLWTRAGVWRLFQESGGTPTNGKENFVIKDENGDIANLTISNVNNGVIQVIETVLLLN